MAYTPISNSALLIDKPWSSALAIAVRDNPIEIAKGSTGAPYVATGWHPYDGVNVGDAETGTIYDFAVHGAVSSVVSPDFEDGYEYLFFMESMSTSAVTTGLEMSLFRETTGSYQTVGLVAGTGGGSFASNLCARVEVFRPRVVSGAVHFAASGGTPSVASAVILTTAQKITRARFTMATSATINGGTIRMLRRLAF